MRVVLDTNFLVSGIINPYGKPARILNLLLAGKITALYDNRMIREYQEVLSRRRFGFSPEWIRPLMDYIKMEGEFVLAEPLGGEMKDASDRKFLEVALSGKADYLITGNKRDFPRQRWIVDPAEFLRVFLEP